MKARKGLFASSLVALFVCIAPDTARSENLLVLGKYNGSGYELEFEVALAGAASGVDVWQGNTLKYTLMYDAGEGQWDVESGGLNYTALNDFLSQGFDLRIEASGNTSVYNVTTGTLSMGEYPAGDFPVRASSLDISTSGNPTRPTATWSGGDATADFLFLTFTDLITDNEFTDQITPVVVDSAYTLQQDLAPGQYDVALDYWRVANTPADTFAVSHFSGPDIFSPDPNQTGLVGVGETLSYVSIVPLPAAGLLFTTGLLGLVGLSRRKKAV